MGIQNFGLFCVIPRGKNQKLNKIKDLRSSGNISHPFHSFHPNFHLFPIFSKKNFFLKIV